MDREPSIGELRRSVLLLARRHTGSDADPEDIAQEALFRAWRHRDSLKSHAALRPWLEQIVRNEVIRAHARQGEGVELENAALPAQSDQSEEVALRIDLDRELAKLDPHERTLIRMRYVEDLTQPDIAARLRLPEGTVKVQLHRARQKLRRALSES